MVIGALTTEFAVLGLIAGFIASLGSELTLFFIQYKLLSLQPSLHPELWLMGIALGLTVITTLGLLRTREIISVPPLQSLRQLSWDLNSWAELLRTSNLLLTLKGIDLFLSLLVAFSN